MIIQESSRKERIGWYFYDWANSAFYTTVITVFLGPYLTSIASNAADANGNVIILGIEVYSASLFAYSVALSVILQVIFLPVVGAFADYSNIKKHLLGVFAFIGSIATMSLYFLKDDNYIFGAIFFIIANLCFGSSIVVYNAFLNELAMPERRDAVSSVGWAFGYLGGGLVLLMNLMLYMNAEKIGISESDAIRISLCSAGAWWAIFTIIPLLLIKSKKKVIPLPRGEKYVFFGFKQFIKTIKDSVKYPQTLLFLIAFLFYNEGVQTVIVIAAQFAREELKIGMDTITAIILMVQFVAFIGSLLFGWIANLVKTKIAILISLFIWSFCILYSYYFLTSESQFIVLSVVLAIVLGGTQALSRSMYSKMIPPNKEAEYFSIFEISDKGTSWLGPLLFGLSLQLTNSYRFAILSLLVFFIIGIILLLRVKST